MMKRIGIIVKSDKPEARPVLKALVAWLEQRDRDVYLDSDAASLTGARGGHPKSSIPSMVDMVIVLGGDGTLLSVARLVEGKDVPIFGVNLGGLGFLTEVPLEELYPTLEEILRGEFAVDERMMLRSAVRRQGETVAQSNVLNEVVVSKGTLARMIRVEISVDGRFVSMLRADGIIVSTPTGSTAYSMSSGGPIVHPTVDAILLTPISPHTLTQRPIVIPNTVTVDLTLHSDEQGAMVTFDGQVGFSLRRGDVVGIRASQNKIKLLRVPAKDYFEVLRKKLGWGGV